MYLLVQFGQPHQARAALAGECEVCLKYGCTEQWHPSSGLCLQLDLQHQKRTQSLEVWLRNNNLSIFKYSVNIWLSEIITDVGRWRFSSHQGQWSFHLEVAPIKSSGLSVTQTASANQNVTKNILCENNSAWPTSLNTATVQKIGACWTQPPK